MGGGFGARRASVQSGEGPSATQSLRRAHGQATAVADGLVRDLGAQQARTTRCWCLRRRSGVIRRAGDLGAPSFDRDGGARNYDLAPYMAGAAASSDPMPRDLRSWPRRAKDKAETERYRTRARGAAEEAQEEESSAEAGV